MADDNRLEFGAFAKQLEEARYADYQGMGVRDEEAFEAMKAYLQALYKDLPVTRSFTTAGGQVIDCVPADQQPVLRRLGLKLESPPARPASPANGMVKGLDPAGCPEGCVPFPRVTLETLSRFRTLRDFFSKEGRERGEKEIGVLLGNGTKAYSLGTQNVDNTGSVSALSLWNPATPGTNSFSLTQIWVVTRTTTPLQTVEAGWQAYPRFYGDKKSHFFIYFTPDGYQSGCYNLSCDAFVQLSKTHVPGMALEPVSQIDGKQIDFELEYHRNAETGSWWLYFDNDPVGYYPKALFKSGGLTQKAERVDFGGEVDASDEGNWPSMGSGRFPSEGYQKAAYLRDIHYLDMAGKRQKPTLSGVETKPDYYKIKIGTDKFGTNSMFYGGPGV